jgi:hypothetical protein
VCVSSKIVPNRRTLNRQTNSEWGFKTAVSYSSNHIPKRNRKDVANVEHFCPHYVSQHRIGLP